MKVAIVGAGLSGLSCAFELKKHGITPTIFEKNTVLGDSLDYAVSNFKIMTNFYTSPRKYFKKNYGLDIVPVGMLKKIIMIGPSNQTVVRGRLGYILKKGLEPYSMENQIARQVNLPINFNTYVRIDDIKDDFDYIVWATGNNKLPRELNLWTSTFNTYIRIATLIGNFKTSTATAWLNTEYARNGYAYLTPYSKKNATLTLIVNNIVPEELDFYWKEFLDKEHIEYKILETRDVEYIAGTTSPMKLNNIYFVGNSGGLTESCLGCGSINAIESGIITARCIAKKLDYDKLMKKTVNLIKTNHEFRKVLNTFDNNDFDKFVAFLGLPVVKQFIYNNPFFKANNAAQIIKYYNKFVENSI